LEKFVFFFVQTQYIRATATTAIKNFSIKKQTESTFFTGEKLRETGKILVYTKEKAFNVQVEHFICKELLKYNI